MEGGAAAVYVVALLACAPPMGFAIQLAFERCFGRGPAAAAADAVGAAWGAADAGRAAEWRRRHKKNAGGGGGDGSGGRVRTVSL